MTGRGPKIHQAAIQLLAKYFNSHKKGLPEWLKNSREAYLRCGAPESERIIIVHVNTTARPAPLLEVIDFAGVSGQDIEDKFLVWANPDAANAGLKAEDVEGGQGNGGKAYLRQLFAQGYFASLCDSKLSVVSFVDAEKFILGFVPDEATGKDFAGDSPVLKDLRKYGSDWLTAYDLPKDHNFTCVRGVGPNKPLEPDKLLEEIQQFPQARQTIRSCKVHYYLNGRFRRELSVREPDLHPDFPAPISIPVPEKLPHPDGFEVSTTKKGFAPGSLELRIAGLPLRGQALGSWNRIDFRAAGVTVIGFEKVEKLPLSIPQYGIHVFGTCTLPLLKDVNDDYEMQGRGELNDGPLSRALYHFIAAEADKRLATLVKKAAGATEMKKRQNLEKLHKKLTSWIEEKLLSLQGLADEGDSTGTGKKRGPRGPRISYPPAVSLAVHRSKLDICTGASYELRAVAYDASKAPVPPGKVSWMSADTSVASVHPDNGLLQAKAAGITAVTVKNIGGLSGQALVAVHEATEIRIKAPSYPAKVGSNRRVLLGVAIKTANGKSAPKDTVVSWRSSDSKIATVGQDGYLVGGEVGDTEVTAFAKGAESEPLAVSVEKGAGGQPKGGGKGKPRIYLSGQDECPFDHQKFLLEPTDPPVHQRAYKPDSDNNVFWINLQHPLANALLASGEASLQWRTYHFQRIVDVFTILEMRRKFSEGEIYVDDVLEEIQAVAATLYSDLREAALFDVLYADKVDLADL